MLRTKGCEFERQQSVSNEVELAREGQIILRVACGFSDWPSESERYHELEKALHAIPPTHVGQFFLYHMAGQEVFFKHAGLEVDLTTLELELRGLCEKFYRTPEYFVMDALSATSLLHSFYHGKAIPSSILQSPLTEPPGAGATLDLEDNSRR